MNKMTYTEFIRLQLINIPTGTPVFVRDLAVQLAKQFTMDENEAKAATAVAMNRMNGKMPNLRFYQKGIYYLAEQTVFGETGINKEKLIAAKYLLPDIGYETGPMLMHRLGLTTLIPCERQFATNKAAGGMRKDTALGIVLKPARTEVTARNKKYLQLLDILNAMDEMPVDAEKPYRILYRIMKANKLDYKLLLKLAGQFYGKNAAFEIARMVSKGEDE